MFLCTSTTRSQGRSLKLRILVRWKEYESKHNVWRNLSKLDNAMNLVKDYENAIKEIVFLLERHSLLEMKKWVIALQKTANSFDSSFTISSLSEFDFRKNTSVFISIFEKEVVLSKRKILFKILVSKSTTTELTLSKQTSQSKASASRLVWNKTTSTIEKELLQFKQKLVVVISKKSLIYSTT